MSNRGGGRGDVRGRGDTRGRGDGRGQGDIAGRGQARGQGDIRGRGQGDGRGRGDARGQGDIRGRGDGRGRGDIRGRGDMSGRGDRGYERGGRAIPYRGRGTRGGPTAIFRYNEGPPPPPHETVEQVEQNTFSAQSSGSIERKNPEYGPMRPAFATNGRRITVWANYFELLPDKTQPCYRYDVGFLPSAGGEEPKGKKRARLMQLLLEQLPQNIPLVSDFATIVLTTVELGFAQQEYLVTYVRENEQTQTNGGTPYRAQMRYTSTVQFGELLDYLSSTNLTQAQPTNKDQIIQAMNIIVGYGMKSRSDMIAIKNNYFPYDNGPVGVDRQALRNGLEAFRGFFMSVRAATSRILLNVQVQHIAVWEALPLPALYQKMRSDGMSARDVSRSISGLWVQLSHLNERLKRIAGLAAPGDGRQSTHAPVVPLPGADARQTKFWKDDGTPPGYLSVADYFQRTYRALRQPDLPVVNVGTRQTPVYLPMEVCTVRRRQEFTQKLSPPATAEMIRFAVRKAPDNARTISERGGQLLQQYASNHLRDFGVGFRPSLITVTARVLPGVAPMYGRDSIPIRDASWNMRNIRFSKGAVLPEWSFLWIRTAAGGGSFASLTNVSEAVTRFRDMMVKCGIQAPKPLPGKPLLLTDPDNPDSEIETFFRTIQRLTLVLVILPFQSTAIYNAVKRAGDIKFGIHTVDVVAEGRKFAKMDDNSQYFANVALKFNLKFGGQNQLLRPADLGFVAEGKTMMVGLDVTHPSPGSVKDAPSISSITASIDASLAQWPADVSIQTGRREMIDGLKEMIKSRLRLWQKHNQTRLPEEIIVFRDGVGESMYSQVQTVEIPQIREACAELYPATVTQAGRPYLTVVICNKRIKTRFYPTTEAEQDDRTGGTRNGTIVDRGITETRIWDFFFQAHTAIQGTPKPTHYVVVHDEIFRRRASTGQRRGVGEVGQQAANDLEKLVNACCHMFGRATKAVSLIPPAYYADLVCDRARRWLSADFEGRTTTSEGSGGGGGGGGVDRQRNVRVHDRLKDSMFYI